MYNILIADDEYNTLNKLKAAFEETRLFNIDTASDGQTALELALKNSYDALLLDIMMPQLSGIELLERIDHIAPPPVKVIITGYDRIEFAMDAIKYGVSEFILKPMDSEDISRLSVRIAEIIERKRAVKEREAELIERADEMKDILKQRFLETLASIPSGGEYINENLARFGIVFDEPFFSCAVLSVKDKNMHLEGFRQMMLLERIGEPAKKDCKAYAFGLCDGSIGIIFNIRSKKTTTEVDAALTEIIELARLSWNTSLICGIGSAVNTVANIPLSFKQAKDAFLCGRALDFSPIMHYSDLNERFDELSDQLHYDEICTALKTERTGDIEDRIKYICKKNYASSSNLKAIQMIVSKVIFACQTMCMTYEIEPDKAKMQSLMPIVLGGEVTADIQIETALCSLITDVSAKIKRLNECKYNYIVTRAKKYIDGNYMQDISVIEIAEKLGVNNNYLGKLFKNAMGVSISHYINNVRIQKAIELLDGTNKKLYEIGEEVGYNNQHYFSTMFKQIVGVSPSEYRDIM